MLWYYPGIILDGLRKTTNSTPVGTRTLRIVAALTDCSEGGGDMEIA